MCKRLSFLIVVVGLLSSSAFAGYNEDPNLFLHFEFDEGAGTTITSTVPGASASGTWSGGPAWDPNDIPTWINVAGSHAEPNGPFLKEDMGTGLDFDDIYASSFNVWIAPDPNLNKATRALTMTFWMKTNSAVKNLTYSRLMYKSGQWDFYFYNRSTNWNNGFCTYKEADTGGGAGGRMFESFNQVSYTEAPFDQWNLWGYRYDPVENLRRCWVNGTFYSNAWGNAYDPNLPLVGNDNWLEMFNRYNGNYSTPAGQFDDLRMFNRALEDYEFARLPGMGVDLKLPYNPNPASETDNMPITGVELIWSAGSEATSHKIFYGKDFDDVNTAVAGAPPAGVTEVDRALGSELVPLGQLDLTATYHWRVDEGESGGGWYKGPVWNFSTTNNATVENFEAYTTDADMWKVWLDSWPSHGNGPANNSGSTVRIEGTIVNNGSGAMKLIYDNCNDWGYGTDHYSETEGSTAAMVSDGSSVVGGNFAFQGCKALDLYYKGDAGNAAQQMYIGFTDGTKTAVKVLKVYDRYGVPTSTPDTGAVQDPDWTLWQVDLVNNMNSVNTGAITKVYLGTGVRGQTSGNPSGTVGTVYFDDLALFQPRCYAQYVDTDFTGDCKTDESDVGMMTGEWLNSAFTVNLPAPSAPAVGPIMHYTFDNNDLTNSGSYGATHDMNSNAGSYSFIAGKVGASALHLDGISNDPMWIPDNNCINVNDLSMTFWYKWEGVQDRIVRKFKTWDTSGRGISITPLTSGSPASGRIGIGIGSGSKSVGRTVRYAFDPDPAYTEWFHFAVALSRDVNGILAGDIYIDSSNVMLDPYYLPYGTDLNGIDTAVYDWQVDDSNLEIGDSANVSSFDDFRIYDYALTHAEVRSIYGATGAGVINRGPTSQYGGEAFTDLVVDQTINFKDFAELGKKWLEEDLWPFVGAAE